MEGTNYPSVSKLAFEIAEIHARPVHEIDAHLAYLQSMGYTLSTLLLRIRTESN